MGQVVKVGEPIALKCEFEHGELHYYRGRVNSTTTRHYLRFKGGTISVPSSAVKEIYHLETNLRDLINDFNIKLPDRVMKAFKEQTKQYLGRYCEMYTTGKIYKGVVTGVYLINNIHELKLLNDCDNIDLKFGYKIVTDIGNKFLDEPLVLKVKVVTKLNKLGDDL